MNHISSDTLGNYADASPKLIKDSYACKGKDSGKMFVLKIVIIVILFQVACK